MLTLIFFIFLSHIGATLQFIFTHIFLLCISIYNYVQPTQRKVFKKAFNIPSVKLSNMTNITLSIAYPERTYYINKSHHHLFIHVSLPSFISSSRLYSARASRLTISRFAVREHIERSSDRAACTRMNIQ